MRARSHRTAFRQHEASKNTLTVPTQIYSPRIRRIVRPVSLQPQKNPSLQQRILEPKLRVSTKTPTWLPMVSFDHFNRNALTVKANNAKSNINEEGTRSASVPMSDIKYHSRRVVRLLSAWLEKTKRASKRAISWFKHQ